jgi:hypothetical protein
MPKRSVDRPYCKNKYEQARINQRCYGQMEMEKKKINPVFKEDHYGIVKKGGGQGA